MPRSSAFFRMIRKYEKILNIFPPDLRSADFGV